MRSLSCAAALVVCATMSFSQIPNPGFETWASGEPVGWATTNAVEIATPVTQSATARSGTSAVRGEVVPFPEVGAIQPILQTGEDGTGFQVSERHATLSGYYQFSPLSGDQFTVNCAMFKNGQGIGVGAVAITAEAGTYTQFNATISYFTDETPDTCIIQFQIIGPTGADYHVGSWVLIDDLSFSGTVTAIGPENTSTPLQFSLSQNYPNPFNGIANFELSIAKWAHVDLKVFDILGREVATLLNERKGPGVYPVQWNSGTAPSGLYFYKVRAGEFVETRRMVLVK